MSINQSSVEGVAKEGFYFFFEGVKRCITYIMKVSGQSGEGLSNRSEMA